MSMKRICLKVATVLIMMGMFVVPVHATDNASEQDTPHPSESTVAITPFYSSSTAVNHKLTNSGCTLNIGSHISAQKSSYNIKMTVYLEEKNGSRWTVVNSWTSSGIGSCSINKSYTGVSGKTYRARLVATVNGEKVSKSSSKTI